MGMKGGTGCYKVLLLIHGEWLGGVWREKEGRKVKVAASCGDAGQWLYSECMQEKENMRGLKVIR